MENRTQSGRDENTHSQEIEKLQWKRELYYSFMEVICGLFVCFLGRDETEGQWPGSKFPCTQGSINFQVPVSD